MVSAVGCVASCATTDPLLRADIVAGAAGMHRGLIRADPFVLTEYDRIARVDRDINVYIEGDGFAWMSRSQPSFDPTPRKANGLRLAVADRAPNVVYLARPCQYTPMSDNSRCDIPYWTSKRYAPEVIASINSALDEIVVRAPGRRLNLIGYSGGAAVAVLVAARRTDVATIRTVAGNLDVEYVNRAHDVSSMPESLNPIDFAKSVSGTPQIHFTSSSDSVVPPAVAQRYVRALGSACAQVKVVEGLEHEGDWDSRWPTLLREEPNCEKSTPAK